MLKIILMILLAITTSACSGFGLMVANTAASFGDYEVVENVSYGPLPRQKLDIYIPEHKKTEKVPVIVFIHGGSWQNGSKEDYEFAAEALTSKGYIAVVPSYRLYPGVKFPKFVNDCAKATLWTRENIASYDGDLNKIYVMGHSAGAHIAAMLALNEEYLNVPKGQNWLCGAIGLAGAYDFLPFSEGLKRIFGPHYEKSQPIVYVDGNEPPLLLLHGRKDELVGVHNTENLARKIELEGGEVKAVYYDEIDHVGVVSGLSVLLRSSSPVLKDVAEFIEQ